MSNSRSSNDYIDSSIDPKIRQKVDNYLKHPGSSPLVSDKTTKPEIEKIQLEIVKMINELQKTNGNLGDEYNKRGIFDGQRKKLEKQMGVNDQKVDLLKSAYMAIDEKRLTNQFAQDAAAIMQNTTRRKL